MLFKKIQGSGHDAEFIHETEKFSSTLLPLYVDICKIHILDLILSICTTTIWVMIFSFMIREKHT